MGLTQEIQTKKPKRPGDDGDDDDDGADAWCQCVSGPGESLSIQNWPYPPTTSTRYTSLPNTQILNLKYTTIHSKCIKNTQCIGLILPTTCNSYISLKPSQIHKNTGNTLNTHTMEKALSPHIIHQIHLSTKTTYTNTTTAV